ncbi:hypothetical protein [Gryllotalpicola ginsengisoli]|uniref:hypothetical protein n=1 Tax=Gryllotalpicola ginsengisoli TaxID=444608 RepID=UPI0003B521BF|nr:hypothetical protein [Gryllotalpicola ginsengisoli]
MTERHQRAIRGMLAATLAVFVAALFHVAGGGAVPGTLGVIVSLAFAVPASVLLTGPRPAMWRLAASVVVSQVAFHVLFSLGQPSAVRLIGDARMAGMPGMGLSVSGASAQASVASPAAQAAMWVGHAAAALVTIAALRHGERVLARMLALAALGLRRALDLVQARPLPRPRFTLCPAPRAARTPALLLGMLRHRGPPVPSPAG